MSKVLFISQIITTLLGFLVYQTIIKHRRTQLSSLVGHGFIIPFCFYMPYTIINSMNSNNMIVRFGLVKPFVHSIFRIWEGASFTNSNLKLLSVWMILPFHNFQYHAAV